MTLYWKDEGDGYEHAHLSPECKPSDREVADVIVNDLYTTISITYLPPMPPPDAKRLAESLYETATLFVKLRAERTERDG